MYMKKILAFSLGISSILLIACGGVKNETESKADSSASMVQDSLVEITFDAALVANKKDPSCGMPVTAGISDTAHYDNKVFGFCSTECKNDFLKNPKSSIAAAELK